MRVEFIWRFCQTYFFSFLFTGIIIPIIATAITAEIYVISTGNALQVGAWITFIVWLIIALLYYYFATVKGANIRSYGLLQNRLDDLDIRIEKFRGHSSPPHNLDD